MAVPEPSSEGFMFRSQVRPEQSGLSLLQALAQRFTYYREDEWAGRLSQGLVHLNGILANGSETVVRDDEVAYLAKEHHEPDVPQWFDEIHADEDFLVVGKPAGVPVHATARIFRNTFTGILRRAYEEDGIVPFHRLDRETSGLMLFARTRDAASRFGRRLSDIFLRKWYLARVFGDENLVRTRLSALPAWYPTGNDSRMPGSPLPDPQTWPQLEPPRVCDIRLGENPDSPIRDQVFPTEAGKECRTIFWLVRGDAPLASASGPPPPPVPTPDADPRPRSYILCELLTGRKHQIRAHLAHLGIPVVGDRIYNCGGRHYLTLASGGELSANDVAELGAEHQQLHSWRSLLWLPSWDAPRLMEAPLHP